MRDDCFSLLKALMIAFFLCQNITSCVVLKTESLYFYASQKGKQTLDKDANGGNPFASALVELLDQKSLIFKDFRTELINLTQLKSENLQQPEVPDASYLSEWQILPKNVSEKRIALVLVYSNYSIAELPGAKHDMYRVATAFSKAGFEIKEVIDPNSEQLTATLEEFADQSSTADIAVIYATGHGVELNQTTYLLPIDYPFSLGSSALAKYAIRLSTLESFSHAKKANLLFYGACRNNPFEDETLRIK